MSGEPVPEETLGALLLTFSGYITALFFWGIIYGNAWQLQLQH